MIAANLLTSDGSNRESIGSEGWQHTPGEKSSAKIEAPLTEGGNLEARHVDLAFGSMKTASSK